MGCACVCTRVCLCVYKRQRKVESLLKGIAHGELLKNLCYISVTDVTHNLGLSSPPA